ncbi:UDPGT domain-containing protein [Cephalotus follicularis]|uniref:UDPGT domain-containing protein n=1 Tax=Cephalotus follicularis TaxID=3775 RepID=A0A1Q3BNW8_CEPFO|nr:UDPGT domain-containing protein [Cephalotus follicularis]
MLPIESSRKQHVVVMAFPFGTHAIPLFNLVRKLAIAIPNTHFSFFNTYNSNKLIFLASNSSNIPSNIKAYNIGDGVPMNNVFTNHPIEAVELFVKATPENFYKGLEAAITEIGIKISSLITDAFLSFAVVISKEMNVPWIPVWVSVPYTFSIHVYIDLIRQLYENDEDSDSGDKTLELIPGLSKIHIKDLPDVILPINRTNLEESPFECMLSKLGRMLPQSANVDMNFYQELYPIPLLDDLKSKFPNLLNVGYLTLSMPPPPPPLLSDLDVTGCLSWLDRQKAMSVAYISFGTVATLPHNETLELAEAVEASGVPFLWSLKDKWKDYLPNGFLERTSMQGKVIPWAPQTQVLAHSSTGVFVTHFGSNSVNESIANGVPMIGRPFFGDHPVNGRIVEEIQGIGLRVEGDVLTKSRVIKSLELVLVHEQGKEMRKKVQSLKEIVLKAAGPNGSAAKDFKTLVEKLSM